IKQRQFVVQKINTSINDCSNNLAENKLETLLKETPANFLLARIDHSCLNNSNIVKLVGSRGGYGLYEIL
ncbi:MAG TPA: hypothetical protein VMR41_06130, partial [Patescibacteria group bacterium]|nr:hypothetical protein [Patescibacteria group bacterium]